MMLKILTLIFPFIRPSEASADSLKAKMDILLPAMAWVESRNNPNCIGDDGDAIGIYQIHYAYWQDAVEHDKTIGGKYEDCFKPKYAEKIVRAYMDRYAPENATFEQLARIHNGGPSGHNRNSTIKYWKKIQKRLNNEPDEHPGELTKTRNRKGNR